MPCDSCGAPLWFCWTKDGRQMPVNATPPGDDQEGNVICLMARSGNGMVVIPLSAVSDEYREFAAKHARTSHFATCPQADKHRKPPPARVDEDSRQHRDDDRERAEQIAANPDALRDRDRPGK